jgi:nucleoside-diphosphate-sugar epimerase
MHFNTLIRRAVVTGSGGFLGRHVMNLCHARGIECLPVVRNHNFLSIQEAEKVVTTSDDDWRRRIQDFSPDAFLHLAAWSGLTHRPEDIDTIVDSNIRLGIQLAEVAVGLGHQTSFVHIGSFWQYSRGGNDYAPNSFYAATKEAFATLLQYYQQVRGLRCSQLIFYDVYGEGDLRRRLLSQIAEAVSVDCGNLHLTDGNQEISFVHVDDAAAAVLHAANIALVDKGVVGTFSVAGDDCRPLRQQIETLLIKTGSRSKLLWGARAHSLGAVMLLPTLQRLPGWRPLVSLEEGFNRMRHEF